MNKLVFEGCIDSDFEGFNDNMIFKMSNGTYWIQARYEYWYHYAYRPKATISYENGRYKLTVFNRSIEVHQLSDVIESRIDGTFEGWNGHSKYRLANGQEWEQTTYKYEYKYSYSPQVVVVNHGGRYIMSVAGTCAEVRRIL